MISESYPWKNRLLADADVVERWAAKTKDSQRRTFLIEQKIFLAAYAIRKLQESEKLSTSLSERSIRCEMFTSVSDQITSANAYRLDELYDLERSTEKAISVRNLLNLIIHSLVFAELSNHDANIEGFFVTSDRKRYEGVWLVELREFLRLMRDVGRDNPSTLIRVFDRKKNDWFIWQGDGEPPRHVAQRLNAIRDAHAKKN